MNRNVNFVVGIITGILISLAGTITVYAATQNKKLWLGLSAANSISTSADGQIVYLVNPNGVFKSTDGGGNWEQIYQ